MVKSEMSDMDDNSTKSSSNPPSPMIEVVDNQENKSTNGDHGHLADHQVSIYPTFFERQKISNPKCVRKMLMKSTTGVNFINILGANIR